MKTKQIYYQDSYKSKLEAVIIEVQEPAGSLLKNIILDQTIFFPEGGGQPGDQGKIIGKNGSAKIEYTRIINDDVIHQGKVIDTLTSGEKVMTEIDWNSRFKYMKIHSAGHLIHDVLMTVGKNLIPLKGGHGQKAFLEYQGSISEISKETLEAKVNETAAKDLPIVTKEATYEELVRDCQFIPPSLPKDKALRMIKIGDFPPMPDGGVHIKSSKEIGKIVIVDLISKEGKTLVKYRVF